MTTCYKASRITYEITKIIVDEVYEHDVTICNTKCNKNTPTAYIRESFNDAKYALIEDATAKMADATFVMNKARYLFEKANSLKEE